MEPSLSHNADFIHAGAEDCLGWEGAADSWCKLFKLLEMVTTAQIRHLSKMPGKGKGERKNTRSEIQEVTVIISDSKVHMSEKTTAPTLNMREMWILMDLIYNCESMY